MRDGGVEGDLERARIDLEQQLSAAYQTSFRNADGVKGSSTRERSSTVSGAARKPVNSAVGASVRLRALATGTDGGGGALAGADGVVFIP